MASWQGGDWWVATPATGRWAAAGVALLALTSLVVAALVLAILFMLSALAVPFAALLSMVLALFAAVVQRWLFFAEAQHVSSLFYGAKAA